jgi:ankyrin repeat protein
MMENELIMHAQGTVNINVPKVVILIPVMLIILTGCYSPLHTAAGKGDIVAVKESLAQGADVNAKDRDGYTPLSWAVGSGRIDVVKLLIEQGADVNAKERDGWTPLLSAAKKGHFQIAQLLIEKGADVEMAIVGLERYGSSNPAALAGKNWLIQYKTSLASQKPAPGETSVVRMQEAHSVTAIVKSDIDVLPAVKAKTHKRSFAIVIGVENYRQKLPKADFATQDANLVFDYLTKVMGYPEENIVKIANEHATKSDFEKYFEKWLPNNIEQGGSVFIYYSGHGAPNPKTGDAYLVPYDGDPAFIDETGYSLKRMYTTLGKLPVKEVIVVLDSCFSGAGGRSVLAKGARPIVLSIENPILLSKNMTVLSASAGDQTSSTYDEKGHGLFTYFLLKGIKNQDVVKQDGSIDIRSLFDYIKPQVSSIARKKYNNEQTPQLVGAKI